MAVRLRKDGLWEVYYRAAGGRRASEYFGRGPQGEARAFARDDELGLRRTRPKADKSGPTFLELAREYRNKKDFNENSRKQLGIRLEAHLIPFFGHRPAARIRGGDVDDYVRGRRGAGISDATICRELTDLKAILNWSTRRDPPLIPVNPIANYRKPREQTAPARPPSEEEARRILRKAPEHVRRCILLAWYLGLRPGAVELLALPWNAVRWESNRILVTSAKKGGPAAREVPIHPEFIPELKRWLKADKKNGCSEYVIHWQGERVRSIGRAWRAAVAAAKIGRRIRPYDLRHYFISHALEEGGDLKALSEIVGSSPKTLLKFYQHVTTRQHEKTIALVTPLKLGPAPKKKRKQP